MSTSEAATPDVTEAAPPAATTPSEMQSQDEVSLVEEHVEIIKMIDRMISRSGSEAFVKALQKSFATQIAKELHSNTYELMKHVALRSGMNAQAIQDLEEDYEDLRDELANQGRVLRDLISTSIVQIAWNLARICLERSQDNDIRALSQNIINALTPQTTEAMTPPAPAQPEPAQVTP